MNARQRRKASRTYYRKVRDAIGDSIFDTDMVINESSWLLFRCLSVNSSSVFVFNVITLEEAAREVIEAESEDLIFDSEGFFLRSYREEYEKLVKSKVDADESFWSCESIINDTPIKKKGYQYTLVNCKLNVPFIDRDVIINLIKKFRANGEQSEVGTEVFEVKYKNLFELEY